MGKGSSVYLSKKRRIYVAFRRCSSVTYYLYAPSLRLELLATSPFSKIENTRRISAFVNKESATIYFVRLAFFLGQVQLVHSPRKSRAFLVYLASCFVFPSLDELDANLRLELLATTPF